MKPETKLKVAAEEIKEVLRKHDIAANFALHTPGHAEHVIYLTTSYSCAYIYEDNSVQYYANEKDFKSVEQRDEKIRDTSNMLKLLFDCTMHHFTVFEMMSKRFDEISGAEHSHLKEK